MIVLGNRDQYPHSIGENIIPLRETEFLNKCKKYTNASMGHTLYYLDLTVDDANDPQKKT